MAGLTIYVTYTGGNSSGDYVYTCADGSTSCQTQINQALSTANANPGSTVIMRGPHTYQINGRILIGSSTTWTAEDGVIVKVANGACGTSTSDCTFPDGTSVIGNLVTYPTGVEICYFEIDGNLQNQDTDLGYAHSKVSSAGSGVERLIQFTGSSSHHLSDIHVHHMNTHDAFGEGAIISWAENVRIHDNTMSNHQHDCIAFKAVLGNGNAIYNNITYGITDSNIRVDSSQNVDIYNNKLYSYTGTNNNGATELGQNGMQIANNASAQYDKMLTQNIKVHDNEFSGRNLCGIWVNDAQADAGTTAQTLHIYNNTFHNDQAYSSWAGWSAGIGVRWGNGLVIENNTFDGCYCNSVMIYSYITTSSTTVTVKNNNMTNTKNYRSGSSGYPSVCGYGLANLQSKYVSVVAEGNYMSNNYKGDYYGVTAKSTATSANGLLPGSSTTTGDTGSTGGSTGGDTGGSTGGSTSTTPVRYIPRIRSSQEEWQFFGYYIQDTDGNEHASYINGWPIWIKGYSPTTSKVISQDKCPSIDGWNLGDFGFEGSTVSITCMCGSIDEAWQAVSAWYARTPAILEFGGPYLGWYLEGIPGKHTAITQADDGAVPSEYYEFTIEFYVRIPHFQSTTKRIRSRLIYNSMQWSADDGPAGNLLKNYSFEEWGTASSMTWSSGSSAADVDWRNIIYIDELDKWVACGRTGSNNQIMVKAGEGSWAVPSGLTNATNCNNSWRCGCWIPPCDALPTGRYVAVSETGTLNRVITSDDLVTFTARTTPSTEINWGGVCYIPINASLPHGRVVAVGMSGTGNRVMYSDDFGVTWTLVASADDAANWISVSYSEVLSRVVAVAYSGTAGSQIMYSNNYGASWTLATSPSPVQYWTNVIRAEGLGLFVACSQTGTQRIMTSADGINSWTLRTTPTSAANEYRCLGWSRQARLLVCVAQTGTGNCVIFSPDAVTWTAGTCPTGAWTSVAANSNIFIAVGSTAGTANQVMTSTDYGIVEGSAPDKWTKVSDGQSSTYDYSVDGTRSLKITGDGTTADIGCISQAVSCEEGVYYILFACGLTSGLTQGQLVVELFSGGQTVKELIWDSTDIGDIQTPKSITVKYDVAPTDAVIKVHGTGTPDSGGLMYCDNVVFEKYSDFELESFGNAITTYGNEDTVPDFEVKGVVPSSSSGSEVTGTAQSFDSGDGTYTSAAAYYKADSTSLEYSKTLAALENNGKYKINSVSVSLATAHAGTTAYCAINVQATSLYGGVKTRVAEFKTTSATATEFTQGLDITAGAGETVLFEYYLKTSSTSYRAIASHFGASYTPSTTQVTGSTGGASNLAIYNDADHSIVLELCDKLPPKCRIRVNSDYTGLYEYSENFEDNAYTSVICDASTSSLVPVYSADNRSLTLPMNGGYITFLVDTKYPITGIPFVQCYTIAGMPKISISKVSNELTPVQWYEIDGNTYTAVENAPVYRELDNLTNLSLAGETTFFVAINAQTDSDCVLGSIFLHCDTVTIDAVRPKVYATGDPNVFVAELSGNPVECNLRFNDRNLVI